MRFLKAFLALTPGLDLRLPRPERSGVPRFPLDVYGLRVKSRLHAA